MKRNLNNDDGMEIKTVDSGKNRLFSKWRNDEDNSMNMEDGAQPKAENEHASNVEILNSRREIISYEALKAGLTPQMLDAVYHGMDHKKSFFEEEAIIKQWKYPDQMEMPLTEEEQSLLLSQVGREWMYLNVPTHELREMIDYNDINNKKVAIGDDMEQTV